MYSNHFIHINIPFTHHVWWLKPSMPNNPSPSLNPHFCCLKHQFSCFRPRWAMGLRQLSYHDYPLIINISYCSPMYLYVLHCFQHTMVHFKSKSLDLFNLVVIYRDKSPRFPRGMEGLERALLCRRTGGSGLWGPEFHCSPGRPQSGYPCGRFKPVFLIWELYSQIYNRFVLTMPIQTLRVNQCGCWEPSDSEWFIATNSCDSWKIWKLGVNQPVFVARCGVTMCNLEPRNGWALIRGTGNLEGTGVLMTSRKNLPVVLDIILRRPVYWLHNSRRIHVCYIW